MDADDVGMTLDCSTDGGLFVVGRVRLSLNARDARLKAPQQVGELLRYGTSMYRTVGSEGSLPNEAERMWPA